MRGKQSILWISISQSRWSLMHLYTYIRKLFNIPPLNTFLYKRLSFIRWNIKKKRKGNFLRYLCKWETLAKLKFNNNSWIIGKVIITRRIKLPSSASFLLNPRKSKKFYDPSFPLLRSISREIEFVLSCLHIASLDYFYELWRDVIENGRICQDNGSVDGHPFGILDGGRKNQKLAAEVVQSGGKLVSIPMPRLF